MDHSEFLKTDSNKEEFSIGLATAPVQALLTPNIGVIGVGGAGGNAVNNMIESHLSGVTFFVANTDAQALSKSLATDRIQLGTSITHGLGAGATPEVGKSAAYESADKIREYLTGLHLLFITAGMGGGTGTGAAPVVAEIAKEMGILTVGVVSKPFKFEGFKRMKTAEGGIKELEKFVDTLIVIPNQNLFRVIGEETTFIEAFKIVDGVLCQGVRSITDLVMNPGLINLDFADVQTVIRQMGRAMMGTGEATGENRALVAAEKAITNPLLDDSSIKGAKSILINISGGSDMTLTEVDIATECITSELPEDANIIFGTCASEELLNKIRVSLVATGLPPKKTEPVMEVGEKKVKKELEIEPPFISEPQKEAQIPEENQPELIETKVVLNEEEKFSPNYEKHSKIEVDILSKIPDVQEPKLINDEMPILRPVSEVNMEPEERKNIPMENRKIEPKQTPKYKSSLFDWVPGLNKLDENKKEHKGQTVMDDDQFTLPSFLRKK